MNKFKARLQAIMSKIPADNSPLTATADSDSVTTTPAAVAETPLPKKAVDGEKATPENSVTNFSCIVETDDGSSRQRDLPADIKTVAIVLEVAISQFLVHLSTAGKGIKKFVPFDTKSLTVGNAQIVTEKLDGKKFTYDLPADTTEIKFEKIDALDCLNTSPSIRQKLKIVVDAEDKQERFSLPPNTCKITIRKKLLDDIDGEDLPDFLKYTLKIFDTSHYEKIDDDEGGEVVTDRKTPSPADFADIEIHTATLAQINHWHNHGGIGYFQNFLMQYGLDWFKPYAYSLFTKYRIGFAEGDTGGSGRGIFPIDDTRYYEIVFKSATPVNAELAKKTLLAFKYAKKTPARGMEKIEEIFDY